jgi:fimbrial chaperone protein
MIASRILTRLALAATACAALPNVAHADGLQVAPVSVTIPERSGVVWLTNDAERPLRAQVRVFSWQQLNGEDQLVETADLIASPPFVEIAPGGQQVIRLVRFGEAAISMAECEQTYRIIVDELPTADAPQQPGLQYVLRYSVPVYLTNPACSETQPQLSWRLESNGDGTSLDVANSGQTHAQLASVTFVAASGQRVEISGGLLGYVLPGTHRRFALAEPVEAFADGGNLEVSVNGSQVVAPVSLADPGQ